MNYKETCWYCGKGTFPPTGSYFTCSSCGATWVEPQELNQPAFSIVEIPVKERLEDSAPKQYKPRKIRRA